MSASAGPQAVLAERARALAQPTEEHAPGADGDLLVVAVTVADQACALEVQGLREVLPAVHVARLPWPQPPITGVTSVRGEIVPVADGRHLLGHPGPTAIDDGPLVVLETGDEVVGLQVDAVHEVISVPIADLVIPHTPVPIAPDLVRAVTPTLVVLDTPAICAALTRSPHQEDMS